jgi:NAD/NADP transhydrogenase beta subunit
MKNVAVRKPDMSTVISTLLVFSAVVAAFAPVVLGDRLVVIASEVVTQGGLMLQDVSTSLQRLLS